MSVRIAKPGLALGVLGVLLVALDLPGSLPGSIETRMLAAAPAV